MKQAQSAISQARHTLRGRVNALKLCVSALDVADSPADVLEFLGHIERAADTLLVALDAYEQAVADTLQIPEERSGVWPTT